MSGPSENPLKRIIRTIHRRSLWQVLAIYAVASWVAFEVVQTLTEGLGLPGWFPAFAFVLLLIGLPVVLATAFVQEGGPLTSGPGASLIDATGREIERQKPEATSVSTARHLFTWRNAFVGGVLVFALWGVIATGWLLFDTRPEARAEGEPEARQKPVAVLPFDNLSPSEEDRYFADGVHDEILTHLARIGDLKVISRTSVLEYRDSPKNLREIASELGAGAVLEGSVRRAGNRVRITAQLIDAESDEHLWAETYERELADIFEVQADVAERIARALRAELTPEEQARIERQPTDDMEAYNAYLRGKEYAGRGYAEDDVQLAIRMFERAVELDPAFAVAWVELAIQHMRIYWYHVDRTEAPLSAARRAIDRALALDAELPEAYLARGHYHYWGHLDYERALRDLERARAGLPGDARVLRVMAFVRRRQGRFDLAVDLFRGSVELDPRSAITLWNLGETQELRREYQEAVRLFDRVITLAPDHLDARITKARVLARGLGDTEAAWEALGPAFEMPGQSEYSPAYQGVLIRLYARDHEAALELLDATDEGVFQTQFYFLPRSLVRARVLDFMDRTAAARSAYDSARVLLERKLDEDPEDSRLHSALGLALAGLEQNEDAIRAGERGMELLPMSREAWRGGERVIDAARIYARVGETEAAIDRLERMLSVPSELSRTALRLDPTWDPLRHHPRFQALLEEAGGT